MKPNKKNKVLHMSANSPLLNTAGDFDYLNDASVTITPVAASSVVLPDTTLTGSVDAPSTSAPFVLDTTPATIKLTPIDAFMQKTKTAIEDTGAAVVNTIKSDDKKVTSKTSVLPIVVGSIVIAGVIVGAVFAIKHVMKKK